MLVKFNLLCNFFAIVNYNGDSLLNTGGICYFSFHKMKKSDFNNLFDSSSEGIVITNLELDVLFANKAVKEIIPHLPDEPVKYDLNKVIDLNCDLNLEISYDLFELEHFIEITKKAFNWQGHEHFIFRIKSKEKDALEQRLSFFLGNIDEVVYTERLNEEHGAKLGFINPGIKAITGLDYNEMITGNLFPHYFAVEEDRERVNGIYSRVNADAKPGKGQFRILNRKTNQMVWVELSLYPQVSDEGDHFANFAIIRDISRDIEADQLLRQSELKHRLLFSEANDAIMIFNGLEMVDCNEKTLTMFDSPGFVEIAGKQLYELMPEKQPDGEDSILQYHYFMQQAISGKSQFFYWRHSKITGEQFDSEVSINSFTIEDDVYVQVIVRDITLRRIAEEQKNQSIKSYFEIFNSSSDLIFIVNSQGEIIDVNQSVLDTYLVSKPEITGKYFEDLGDLQLVSSEDMLKIGKAWAGKPQKFVWHCKMKSGKTIPLDMILHPGTYFGKEVIIATGRDISERLAYEKTLIESESRFRTLASHAPIGIFLTDAEGKAQYVNDKLKQLSHFDKVDKFMENWLERIHPEDRERVRRHIDITEKDKQQQYEYRVTPINDKQRWVKTQVNLLKDQNDKILGRVGTIEDITNQIESAQLAKEAEKEKLRAEFAEETSRRLKKEIDERIAAEEELKSAKEFNQYIINSSIDMIIATDSEGMITEFNQAAANGFRSTIKEVLNTPVDPLFADEADMNIILERVFNDEKWSGEVNCKRADGSEFIGYLSASILFGPDQKGIGTMGVLRDITELKSAEKELKNNVHQKEILLKEVHHRVKNNLQVISSILNLQTGYIDDEATLGVIKECQDRIKSMAFIHESLYQKEDFAAVNFAQYLQNLCNNLKYSYMSPNRNIVVDFDIEEISLSLDSAIPCGLIVNELVSNCFKYAFQNHTTGSIKVSLAKEDNNKVLVVHDSGQGLPQDLNIETNDSLGLQLVWTLVDQIDGDIKYEYDSGSKFIINFKRD